MIRIFSLTSILSAALLCSGCIPDQYVRPPETVVNGGIPPHLTSVAQLDTSYGNLGYGTTMAFWSDELLGLEYGPTYSNPVSTRIAAELVSETRFFSMSDTTATRGLSREISDAGLTVEITVDSLLSLFQRSGVTSKATIGDFIRFLTGSNLLNHEEAIRLREFISQSGLKMEDSITALLQSAGFSGFSITASSSTYLLLLGEYGLQRSVLDQALSADTRVSLLESTMKDDYLKTMSNTGEPGMRLVKHVDKPKAWFGATLTYSLDIINVGSIGAKSVVVVDVLPLGLRFQSFLGQTMDGTFRLITRNGRTILLFSPDATFPANNSGQIQFQVKIPELPD